MQRILNLTGHLLAPDTISEISEALDDTIEILTDKMSIFRAEPVFSQIKDKLKPYKGIFMEPKRHYIILPGFTLAAACVLSYIHGISGEFPAIIELMKDYKQGIYKLKDIHDLERYRHMVRNYER